MTNRFDVYETITQQIADQIAAGASGADWRMPWHGGGLKMPRNPLSGTQYRGVNVPLLWIAAEGSGYSSHLWATYKQWQAAGAQVRKGERSALVMFWKKLDSPADDDSDHGRQPGEISSRDRQRFVARAYRVFAAEQVDGFDLVPSEPAGALDDGERIAAAERFFAQIPATVHHGGTQAFYRPSQDAIQLPEFSRFFSAADYYSTRGHETVHWTKQPHRCDREFSKRFGDQAYAFEELVAELGAAFLCATLGISNAPRPDHAQYMSHWLQVLRGDKRAIFTAATKAQAAVDYLAAFAAADHADHKAAA